MFDSAAIYVVVLVVVDASGVAVVAVVIRLMRESLRIVFGFVSALMQRSFYKPK